MIFILSFIIVLGCTSPLIYFMFRFYQACVGIIICSKCGRYNKSDSKDFSEYWQRWTYFYKCECGNSYSKSNIWCSYYQWILNLIKTNMLNLHIIISWQSILSVICSIGAIYCLMQTLKNLTTKICKHSEK